MRTESKTKDDSAHARHGRKIWWGWWFFAAAGLFYLLSEHQAHLFGVLPYLLLLACPFMHLFMHHGHHEHHGQRGEHHNEQGEKKETGL